MGHPDDDIRSFSQLIPVSATDLRPRIVLGLLFLTGIYQTIQLIGLRVSGLLNSNIGRLIGLKVLTLVVLSGLVLVSFIRNSRSG